MRDAERCAFVNVTHRACAVKTFRDLGKWVTAASWYQLGPVPRHCGGSGPECRASPTRSAGPVADGAFTVGTANTWALGGEGLYSHRNW
jgi:hypothetical protein